MATLTPGGMTETAMRNTFGLETTRTEFTLVSAELTEIVSIITLSAIAMRLFPRNYSMMVSCTKIESKRKENAATLYPFENLQKL